MIWSTLEQFALSGRYTKLFLYRGKLESINNYSLTTAYLGGNYMSLIGYTYILPTKTWGTMGYNLSLLGLALKGQPNFSYLTSYALTGFWMKQYTVNKRISLSPELFAMSSAMLYNISDKKVTKDKTLGIIFGTSVNYSLSRRFGLSFNYKLSTSTNPSMPMLSFFLIGSRMSL
jgi:hypothetical protein